MSVVGKTSSLKRAESGAVMVFVAICIAAMLAVAALAIDTGLLYSEWRDVQHGADLSALGAALVIGEGGTVSQARDQAETIAQENGIDTSTELEKDTDVKFGNWDVDSSSFSEGGTPTNAVQVTARRSVNNIFARMVGQSNMNPNVLSVAVMRQLAAARCVLPFGVEDTNFPAELGIGSLPLDHTFNPPHTFTVGQNSPGNWGKLYLPDSSGTEVNMSSFPNFCYAMLQDDCWLTPTQTFDPCLAPIEIGPDELGEEYDGSTGAAGMEPIMQALIGKEITVLVNSPFGNGKKPVDVYGYANAKITGVSGNGANLELDMEITSLSTTAPEDPDATGTVVRYLAR